MIFWIVCISAPSIASRLPVVCRRSWKRIGRTNLLNIDHDSQVQEMIDLAEIAKRSPQPVQHWILSWRENEQPTTAQDDEAVRMFLGEMGFAEHQAIYALHRNTNIWHVHVAVNRVNPETEKLVTV